MLKRLPLLLTLAAAALAPLPSLAIPRPPEVTAISVELSAGRLDEAIEQA